MSNDYDDDESLMTAMIMTRMVTMIKVIVVCCLMTNDYDDDDESLMTAMTMMLMTMMSVTMIKPVVACCQSCWRQYWRGH